MVRIIEKIYTDRPFRRVLIIKETSYGLHGEVKLYNSCTKKWDSLMGASFYTKDNDATPYRVKEYFGFIKRKGNINKW